MKMKTTPLMLVMLPPSPCDVCTGTSWNLAFGPWADASGTNISHDYGGNKQRYNMIWYVLVLSFYLFSPFIIGALFTYVGGRNRR